ncbi:hypothetical protein [Rubrivirga sp.]|uniref:hypothetical protein n=1 Tax=Rubrivirga sp. TaxID=1885344 RepID=UPI003B5285E8
MHALLADVLGGGPEMGALLAELSGTFPGAIAYVARPAVAERLGLDVAAEVDGVALGLLCPSEGAAHVVGWEYAMEQRGLFDAHIRKDRLPLPLHTASVLALLDRPNGVGPQWLALTVYRSLN